MVGAGSTTTVRLCLPKVKLKFSPCQLDSNRERDINFVFAGNTVNWDLIFQMIYENSNSLSF